VIRDFFAALYRDWLALVSGIASVILAVWVAVFAPTNDAARKVLWLSFAICLFIAAYRIWAAERRRYNALTAYKLIPHIIRKESNIYAEPYSPWQCPMIRASVAIKFENTAAHELSLKRMALHLYERLDGKKKVIKEIPLRGRTPKTVRQSPSRLQKFDDPAVEVHIAGLRINAGHFSQKYFFVDKEMLVADLPGDTLINGKHFLRLSVEAVGQGPYYHDLEIDWTQPGAWPLSVKAAFRMEKIIQGKTVWEQAPQGGDMTFRIRKALKEAFTRKKQPADRN